MRSETKSVGVLLLCFALASGLRAAQLPPLLLSTERLADADALPPGVLMQSSFVTVNLPQLQPEARRFRIPLFEGESVNIAIDHQEKLRTLAQQEAAVWSGRVEGQPASIATLVLVHGVLVANLQMQDGRTFQIRHAGEDVHVLRQIDPSKLPPEGEPAVPAPREGDRSACSTDSPTKIDVLVLYTDDARIAARSTWAMQATIFLAVVEANFSYRNSHIDQRLRLVYMQEVSHDERNESAQHHRDALRSKTDGILDDVHKLRDFYAADVNVLILERADQCGRAYIMEEVSPAFEDSAFAVITRTCSTAKYSFTHELGHLMGARHEWVRPSDPIVPFPYAHGDHSSEGGWRTIMANRIEIVRRPYWSNPNVTYPPTGEAMGRAVGAMPADNHRVLNATAPAVANFRCSSSAARSLPPEVVNTEISPP